MRRGARDAEDARGCGGCEGMRRGAGRFLKKAPQKLPEKLFLGSARPSFHENHMLYI